MSLTLTVLSKVLMLYANCADFQSYWSCVKRQMLHVESSLNGLIRPINMMCAA